MIHQNNNNYPIIYFCWILVCFYTGVATLYSLIKGSKLIIYFCIITLVSFTYASDNPNKLLFASLNSLPRVFVPSLIICQFTPTLGCLIACIIRLGNNHHMAINNSGTHMAINNSGTIYNNITGTECML